MYLNVHLIVDFRFEPESHSSFIPRHLVDIPKSQHFSRACFGTECSAGAVTTLLVADGFYEFLRPACVSLFFTADFQVPPRGAGQGLVEDVVEVQSG